MSREIVTADGRSVRITDLEFSAALPEPWVEYRLEDGSYVRVKTIVTDIMRVEGEVDDTGRPVLAIKTQNIVVQRPPADG